MNKKLFDITQEYSDEDEDDTFTDEEEVNQLYIELKEESEETEKISNSEDEINQYLIELEDIRQSITSRDQEINNICNDLDNILLTQHLPIPLIPLPDPSIIISCNQCYKIFDMQYQLTEHMSIHENEIENNVCICPRCRNVFNSDEEYLAHNYNCNSSSINDIPTNENGEYKCPSCDNRYSNQFYLGEHFIESHNEYDMLSVLDKKTINGFPGLELLEKIEMIRYVTFDEEYDICKICYFDYIIDDEMDEMAEDNRNPLLLKCCKKLICYNCLIHHLSINNNLICPYCIKDHCRDDWKYVTFIDEVCYTERARWIPWWSEHLDIFN